MSIRCRNRGWLVVAAMAGLCLTSGPAHAHLFQTGFGTFYDGVVHFILTPADLLVGLGLGLLAGSCGAAASRGVLLALPGAWLVGGLIGSWSPVINALPSLTTMSFGLVGVLVAVNVQLSRAWVMSLGSIAGLLHGYINGTTIALDGAGWLSLAGATTMAFTLVTLVAALVVSLRAYWTRIVVRVAGSWIAAVGLLMVGWLLRGRS